MNPKISYPCQYNKGDAMERKVKNVAIIGAGLMGFGIGVEYARFGYNVSFYNTRKASSEVAMQQAKEALDLMVKNETHSP